MRVYRNTYKDADGNQQTAEKWYVEFRDPDGKVRRLPAFTDKKQSETLGRNIEKWVNIRIVGDAPDRELRKFMDGLPTKMREHLAKIGVLEPGDLAKGRTLEQHIAGEIDAEGKVLTPGFAHVIRNKGGRADYHGLVESRLRTLVKGCGFVYWRDITADKVEQWLSEQRATGTGREGFAGMSIQTSNFYLQVIKRFCEWLGKKLGAVSPVADLKAMNPDTDPRHRRRGMSLDEIMRVLDAMKAGPTSWGRTHSSVTGYDRWIVSRFALETGLRPKQIRSLTRGSFEFENDPPAVYVRAQSSKNKKLNGIPLRPEMVVLLKEHLKNKLPSATAFVMPSDTLRNRLFRRDLAAARKAWLDETKDPKVRAEREKTDFLKYRNTDGEVADFYAQRHTFITMLVQGGTHPKDLQSLAQHANFNTTMKHYAKASKSREAAALANLPSFAAATAPTEAKVG